MVEVRQLREKEWEQAMKLKIACWSEELAGKAENDLILTEQLDFWTNWMYTATDNHDIRVTLGAFEDDELLGVVAGSIADTTDISEKGIECNGLWVNSEHRNRGVSLRLLMYLLNYFTNFDMNHIVIYNLRDAPSNTFYRKFGVKELRQNIQVAAGVKFLVDVFIIDFESLKEGLQKVLSRYL